MMKYQDVALIDSHYTLMLFCLLYPQKVDKTLFIVSDGVSSRVRHKLPNYLYLPDTKYVRFKKVRELLRNIKYMTSQRFHQLRKTPNIQFYGQDHAWYSFIGRNKPFILLEDGLDNYQRHPQTGIKRKFLSWLGFPYMDMGRSDNIQEIFLTGVTNIPDDIKNKVRIININNLWKKITPTDKNKVTNLFLSSSDIESVNKINSQKSVLILSQPLNQDGIMTESEKIKIYSDAIKDFSESYDIFIKNHPRDNTDYSKFNWISIEPHICPIELFQLLGLEFDIVVTYDSTSIYKFYHSKKIIIKNNVNKHT